MKLIYLYIENHKAISNLQLPISGQHKCHYENENLSLSHRKDVELDYYKGVYCSAIIGKNGVGKSTILDFIESANSGTESSGIIIWFDESSKTYHACPINIHLTNDYISSEYPVFCHDDFHSFCRTKKIRLVKSNNLTGIESNDFNTIKNHGKFVHDMSLSQYTNKSKKSVIERTNRLIRYFENSSFFNHKDKPKVTFTFQFKPSSTSYLKSLLNNKSIIEKSNLTDKEIKKLKNFSISINSNESSKNISSSKDVAISIFRMNLLSISNQLSKTRIIKKENRDLVFLFITLSIIDSDMSMERLYNYFSSTRTKSDFLPDDLLNKTDAIIIQQRFGAIWSKINLISRLIYKNSSNYELLSENTISTSKTKFIIDLSEAISALPSIISNNFVYGWTGFSTGEFAKLNIFSELFHYINEIQNQKFNNHLIVMDEVDLYLHPDWQRTFLSELIEFINQEFSNTNTQLILSTHSPIIISDFLPEDIISLQRIDGKTKIVESFGFASNITEMYLQGMHISSTFGEHSRLAISNLLTRSENNELSKDDLYLIKKIKSKNIRGMLLKK